MNLPQAFANMAARIGAATGAPFYPGKVVDTIDPVFDDGGSILVPGRVVERDCLVQVDLVSDAARPEGWTDRDYRFLILAASLQGGIDTDAKVRVTDGPRAGMWSVSSLQTDPAGIGYTGKGRQA